MLKKVFIFKQQKTTKMEICAHAYLTKTVSRWFSSPQQSNSITKRIKFHANFTLSTIINNGSGSPGACIHTRALCNQLR